MTRAASATSARPVQFDRGDIIELTLDPTAGREHRGRRRVLVLSPREFNRVTGVVFIAPITQGSEYARDMGFTVPLSGTGLDSQGVVLCHQTTGKDVNAREPRKIERAPAPCLRRAEVGSPKEKLINVTLSKSKDQITHEDGCKAFNFLHVT